MSGPFIELTDAETSRLVLINTDQMICVTPHGRSGAYVYVTRSPDRLEVEETPERVSDVLRAAGVAFSERELQE